MSTIVFSRYITSDDRDGLDSHVTSDDYYALERLYPLSTGADYTVDGWGFESWTAGVPDDWTASASEVNEETGTYHTGAKCCECVKATDAQMISGDVEVPPWWDGGLVTVQFAVKRDGTPDVFTDFTCRLRSYIDEGGPLTEISMQPIYTTSTWTALPTLWDVKACSVHIPRWSEYVRVYFDWTWTVAGVIYIDSVSILWGPSGEQDPTQLHSDSQETLTLADGPSQVKKRLVPRTEWAGDHPTSRRPTTYEYLVTTRSTHEARWLERFFRKVDGHEFYYTDTAGTEHTVRMADGSSNRARWNYSRSPAASHSGWRFVEEIS